MHTVDENLELTDTTEVTLTSGATAIFSIIYKTNIKRFTIYANSLPATEAAYRGKIPTKYHPYGFYTMILGFNANSVIRPIQLNASGDIIILSPITGASVGAFANQLYY